MDCVITTESALKIHSCICEHQTKYQKVINYYFKLILENIEYFFQTFFYYDLKLHISQVLNVLFETEEP